MAGRIVLRAPTLEDEAEFTIRMRRSRRCHGGADFAGQGYMTEGMHALLAAAFGRLKLHRLEANIQPGNTASIALAERCGFEREGFSPRYLKIGGRSRDHERWAIRSESWRALRAGG